MVDIDALNKGLLEAEEERMEIVKLSTARIDRVINSLKAAKEKEVEVLIPVFVDKFNEKRLSFSNVNVDLTIGPEDVVELDNSLYVEIDHPITGHPYDRVDFQMSFKELQDEYYLSIPASSAISR